MATRARRRRRHVRARITGGIQEVYAPSLLAVRVVLPAAIAGAGIVLVIVGSSNLAALGVVLIGVGALVVLANVLIRLSISSQRDREREQPAQRQLSGRS